MSAKDVVNALNIAFSVLNGTILGVTVAMVRGLDDDLGRDECGYG